MFRWLVCFSCLNLFTLLTFRFRAFGVLWLVLLGLIWLFCECVCVWMFLVCCLVFHLDLYFTCLFWYCLFDLLVDVGCVVFWVIRCVEFVAGCLIFGCFVWTFVADVIVCLGFLYFVGLMRLNLFILVWFGLRSLCVCAFGLVLELWCLVVVFCLWFGYLFASVCFLYCCYCTLVLLSGCLCGLSRASCCLVVCGLLLACFVL